MDILCESLSGWIFKENTQEHVQEDNNVNTNKIIDLFVIKFNKINRVRLCKRHHPLILLICLLSNILLYKKKMEQLTAILLLKCQKDLI